MTSEPHNGSTEPPEPSNPQPLNWAKNSATPNQIRTPKSCNFESPGIQHFRVTSRAMQRAISPLFELGRRKKSELVGGIVASLSDGVLLDVT
jgi:hypothetical protein